MNCGDLEDKLPYIAGGVAPPILLAAAEAHARECPRCARLLAAGRGEVTLPPVDPVGPPDDLLTSILTATGGPSCPRISDRLIGWTDGELDPVDRTLLAEHLEHCLACRGIAEELARLREELPRLAEIEPDVRFVADVLERTSWAEATRPRFRPGRAARWWRRFLERPQSALEFACGGALLISLLTTAPQQIAHQLGTRPVVWLQDTADSLAGRAVADAADLGDAARRIRTRVSAPPTSLAALPAPGAFDRWLDGAGRILSTLDLAGRSLRAIGEDFLHGRWIDAWREALLLREKLQRCWSKPALAGPEDRTELRPAPARTPPQHG